MARKATDTPLAELTLRKYERPSTKDKRELVRKLCLSLGVLQPGDSRDVIVDVLHVMLKAEKPLRAKDVEHAVIDARKAAKVPILGVAPSNIRRQLYRLRDIFLIEKVKNTYQVRERAKLSELFEEHLEEYLLKSIVKRIKEYLKAADKAFTEKA